MQIDCILHSLRPCGGEYTPVLVTDLRPWSRNRRPVAVVRGRTYAPHELDGTLWTFSREMRQVERAKHFGFQLRHPTFFSREPLHPDRAEIHDEGGGW